MAEAFSKISTFTLYIEKFIADKENALANYGIKEQFIIREIGSAPVWPRSFWQALKFKKIATAVDADTIFFIRDVMTCFWLVCFSKEFRARYFFEIHSLERFPSFMYKIIISRARGIISTNRAKTAYIIKRWGIGSEKIISIPNGVDVRLFQNVPGRREMRKLLSLPLDRFIIMYVGSSQYWKGVETILECAEKFPTYLFVTVGCDIQSHNNVIVVPRVQPIQVPQYLRAADLLVAPYPSEFALSNKWTSPLKIMEYMASGTPIIASNVPSVRELLNENNAHLVSVDKPENLQKEIDWAAKHSMEMERRALLAHDQVQQYSWDERARQVVDFITTQVS